MEEALKLVACTSSAGLDNRYSVSLGFLNRNNQDGLVKMKKKKKKEKVGIKKKLKLLKGLSKDLSAISGLRSAVDRDQNLLAQVPGKTITEAAEALIKQLQQLKTEKELNKKRKQDKAKLKQKQGSACGSDSRDSESEEEIIQGEGLINEDVKREESVPNLGTNSDGMTLTKKRVEVCMGNKWKKSGGAALLEEFQRAIGAEGDVVGCKCLGKCRGGPNIRLFNSAAYAAANDLTPANPLYVGVGLQDVGAIASKFFPERR